MQPHQVQFSNHNLNSSLSTNLLISASTSFSPLNRQSSPFNTSSILHPIAHHPNSHLVHPNQLTHSSINPHSLPLPQSVLQSAQLLRNNYDSLFYVNNGHLPSNNSLTNLPNSINFNAINQLSQLSHHLNQIPIAAAAVASLQQNSAANDNTSDNLSVCSNLSGSLKSEDTGLNSNNFGLNALKLSNSLKNSSTNGQLRCTSNSTPNAVNELKFSVNSILNASNYSSQLRNDGEFALLAFCSRLKVRFKILNANKTDPF